MNRLGIGQRQRGSEVPFFHRRNVILVFAAALVLMISGISCARYDELVEAAAVTDQKWADIEAQLQRRYDLIPNLVNTVKASAKHEEDTLQKVIEARAQAVSIKMSPEDLENPEKMAAFQKAQDQLRGSLSRLMMVQEQYPDLKANQSFHSLQVQFEGTENRILRAREEYNNAVRRYNAELGKVRGQVVNKVTGKAFKPRAYYAASSEAQTAPKVSF